MLGFDVVAAKDSADLVARLADAPDHGRVAVVDRRFVGHRHALRLTLTDPRFRASAAPGLLAVDPAARPALLRAAEAEAARDAQPDTGRLTDALAAAVEVHRPALGALVAAVPQGPVARAAAERAVAAVDDEAVRLRCSVKPQDGLFTTFCVSPYSRYLARWCARCGLTPNQVTLSSLLVALAAAGCAATGDRGGYVAAGVLLLGSFVLDCTDGQLARYALRYSTLGAWLDATCDRVKEYAFYAGLALGSARGGDDVWALALGAMAVQSVRHIVDSSFNESGRGGRDGAAAALSERLDAVGWTVWARRVVVLPIGERWAVIAVLTALTTPRVVFVALLAASAVAGCYTLTGRLLRSRGRGAAPVRAARSLADLADSGPLAEAVAERTGPEERARWLPRVPAPLFAAAGSAALACTAWWAPAGSWWPLVAAVGYALCAGAAVARPLTGPVDWLVPPLFRAAEYLTVLALAATAGDSGVNSAVPAAFGLVAAVAYHHYDTVYRIRGGTGAPPRRLVRVIGGHEGRLLLVTAVAAVTYGHEGALRIALAALAGALALVVLTESVQFWTSSHAPAAPDETGVPA
nr:DUF5941 domain-containing protein [Wenjunlia vitaminophila]